MRFPTLKHPRLCRILIYVVIIGGFFLPFLLACLLPVPSYMAAICFIVCSLALLYYLLRNFMVLMCLDMTLAITSCQVRSRPHYPLPSRFAKDKLLHKIRRYGKVMEPRSLKPQPLLLCYHFSSPMTVYSSGIERCILVYETKYLDKGTYLSIFSSAKTNVKAISGSKKALFLDRNQKNEPVNQVAVIFIFADAVDPRLLPTLSEMLKKQAGDGFDMAFLPCILSGGTCWCDSECIPYMGFQYPVKNRGIRLIRKLVFHGRFPLNSCPCQLQGSLEEFDENTSLWALWRFTTQQFTDNSKHQVKTLKAMQNGDIRLIEDQLYIKYQDKGLVLLILRQEQRYSVEKPSNWSYPNQHPIGKNTIAAIEISINAWLGNQGYITEFLPLEDLWQLEDTLSSSGEVDL